MLLGGREYVVWQGQHGLDSRKNILVQVLIDLLRNGQPPVSWDVAVLVYDIRGVIAGELHKSQVLLRHETLLQTSVTQSVEREVVGVGSHLTQTVFVPDVELASQHWAKLAVVSLGLEEGRVRLDVGVADHAPENVDGADRAQKWTRVIAGERILLDPLTMLDRLGEVELDEDARNAVMFEPTHIAPANQSDFVHGVVGDRHERRGP